MDLFLSGSKESKSRNVKLLFEACTEGNNARVLRLLETRKATVHEKQQGVDNTPLHVAAAYGRTETAHILMDFGALINARNHTDATPLHEAARQGHLNTVRALCDRGCDVNSLDRDMDETPMTTAARENWPKVAMALLKDYGAHFKHPNKHRMTALHYACQHDRYSLVECLVLKGSPLEVYDIHRRTPLALAAIHTAHWRVLKLLVENGARTDAITSLDLRRQRLTAIEAMQGPVIAKFIALKRLDLRDNALDTLPMELAQLANLETVKLRGNGLKMIPRVFLVSAPMRVQTTPSTPSPEGNDLTHSTSRLSVPRSNAGLRSSESSRPTPMTLTPVGPAAAHAAVDPDWNTVREYLLTISGGSVQWRERKVLVVGREGVGKTTLLRCLADKKHKTDVARNVSTDGVVMQKELTLESIAFNTFDFGGQAVFYPTHQFFLTANCIYLVVVDLTNPNLSRLDYWMHTVRNVGGEPLRSTASNNSSRSTSINNDEQQKDPTGKTYTDISVDSNAMGESPARMGWSGNSTLCVIVGTHLDDPKCTPEYVDEWKAKLKNRYPKYRFPQIQDIMFVSCKKGTGVAELIHTMANSSREAPTISTRWVAFSTYLSSVAETEEMVTWETYGRMAEKCGVPPSQLEMVTDFLVDVGTIIYFRDLTLRNIVVLSPQWLAKVFAAYPESLHSSLLALLEKFNILFYVDQSNDSATLPSSSSEEKTADCIEGLAAVEETAHREKKLEKGKMERKIIIPSLLPDERVVLECSGGRQRAYMQYDENTYQLQWVVQGRLVHRRRSSHPVNSPRGRMEKKDKGRRKEKRKEKKEMKKREKERGKGKEGKEPLNGTAESQDKDKERDQSLQSRPRQALSSNAEEADTEERERGASVAQGQRLARVTQWSSRADCESDATLLAMSKKTRRKVASISAPVAETTATTTTTAATTTAATTTGAPPSSAPSTSTSESTSTGKATSRHTIHRSMRKTLMLPLRRGAGGSSSSTESSSRSVPKIRIDDSNKSAQRLGDNKKGRKRTHEQRDLRGKRKSYVRKRSISDPAVFETVNQLRSTEGYSEKTPKNERQKRSNSDVSTPRRPFSHEKASKKESDRSTKETAEDAWKVVITPAASTLQDRMYGRLEDESDGLEALSLHRCIVETVETLLECYYPKIKAAVRRLVPCSHCLFSSILSDAYTFSEEEVVSAVTSNKPFLYCQNIHSITRRVRVDLLAPDLALSDLPQLDSNRLEITSKLGEGGFGMVYRGKYRGQDVAIKELKSDGNDGLDDAMENSKFGEFQREAWVMSHLSHPNLTKLFGITRHPPRMVMEFCGEGDLYRFLHPKRKKGTREAGFSQIDKELFPWPLRFAFALDLAYGLRYMQQVKPPLIHRDLRSPNVFLKSTSFDAPVRAQIADFGLSRMVVPKIQGMLQTWQWLAPEVIDAEGGQYDHRADIYSLAVVFWEIATIGYPFDSYRDDPNYCDATGALDELKVKRGIIHHNLRPVLTAEHLHDIPVGFRQLIEDCWKSDPALRPSCDEIVERMLQLTGSEDKYAHDILPPVLGVKRSSSNVSCSSFSSASTSSSPSVSSSLSASSSALNTHSSLQRQNISDLSNLYRKSTGFTVNDTPSVLLAVFESSSSSTSSSFSSVSSHSSGLWMGLVSGHIVVVDKEGKPRGQWPAHQGRVTALCRVWDTVWSASEDGYIAVWSINTLRCVSTWVALPSKYFPGASGMEEQWAETNHTGDNTHSDSTSTGDYDGSVPVPSPYFMSSALPLSPSNMIAAAVHAPLPSMLLASSSSRSTLFTSSAPNQQNTPPERSVSNVALKKEALEVWSSVGETIRVWDVKTHSLRHVLTLPDVGKQAAFHTITGMTAHGEYVWVYSGSVVRIFSGVSREYRGKFEPSQHRIVGMCASPCVPTQMWLATPLALHLWEADEAQGELSEVNSMSLQMAGISAMACTLGKRILTASSDGTIVVWDAKSGRGIDELPRAMRGAICCLSASISPPSAVSQRSGRNSSPHHPWDDASELWTASVKGDVVRWVPSASLSSSS